MTTLITAAKETRRGREEGDIREYRNLENVSVFTGKTLFMTIPHAQKNNLRMPNARIFFEIWNAY